MTTSCRPLSALLAMAWLAACGGSDDGTATLADDTPQSAAALETGEHTLTSFGVERSFYVHIPDDYSSLGDKKALLVAFHGTGGSHVDWLPGGTYGDGLIQQAGDDAILVFPDALPNSTGTNQWNRSYDYEYFFDLLAKIDRDLGFDPNRLFVTGHSSGGGFTHEIGCQFGDIVRGIAPVAGALTANQCIGATAVIMIQGRNDGLVPLNIVRPTQGFWILYNGFDEETSQPGQAEPCIDYSLGASLYPMQWCLHEEGEGLAGHAWPSFADEAVWNFFAGLPQAEPGTEPPPGGGNDRAQGSLPARMTFTLEYPETIGDVYQLAVVFYPAGSQQPFSAAPLAFLNLNIDPEPATAGTQQFYDIPIQLPDFIDYPNDYTVAISVYVEGGGFPIPEDGIDHVALYEATVLDNVSPVIIEPVLPVVPVQSVF